jgi:DNA-binding FadR family transcriptional regulator
MLSDRKDIRRSDVQKKTTKRTVTSLDGLPAWRKPIKAADQLVRQLIDYIIDKRLEEGARLPPEREMVAETGRGRSTVREALLLLEMKGVVEVRQGVSGGPVVRRPTAADLGEPLTLVLMFDGATMIDVMRARGLLEATITGMAAATITEDQLQQLNASIERQRQNIDNREAFLHESRVFHAVINEAGLNVVTRVLLEALQNTAHMTMIAVEYSLSHRQQVIEEHEKLLAALRARDGELATRVARAHVEGGLSYWINVAGSHAKDPIRWSTRLPDAQSR